MIEPTEQDIGRRVFYANGDEGVLNRVTEAYAFVTFDVLDVKSKKPVPGSVSSPTAFNELSWKE